MPFRRHLVWEVVKQIRAREHRGTHKTKVRSEVSGSRQEAVQAEAHRPRPPGRRTPADPPPRRHGLRPGSALLRPEGEREGEEGGAALRPLREGARKPGRPPRHARARQPQDEGLRGRAREARRRGQGARPRPEAATSNLVARRREQPEGRGAWTCSGINVYDALNAGTIVLSEDALRAVIEVLA